MNRALLALVSALLLAGSSLYAAPHSAAGASYAPGLYDGYLAPAWILRGIARAESGERRDAVGDDGISIGWMQLNERYHAERAAKWGEYDPRNIADSIRIASCLFRENLAELGSEDLAIAAHRQGARGVREHGASAWYIERVKRLAR